MSYVLDRISVVASIVSDDVALVDHRGTVTYGELRSRVRRLASLFASSNCRTIALDAHNGVDWVVVDLAAWAAGSTLVPIPPFFSPAQVEHVLESAAVDTLITRFGPDQLPEGFGTTHEIYSDAIDLRVHHCVAAAGRHPRPCENSAKVTFTSGSTGTPKGVMLSGGTLDLVVRRLASVFDGLRISRHLASMPLATLLENVAGIYLTLTRGGTVCLPSLDVLGFNGSSRVDVTRFARAIDNCHAQSLILQPQLLRELTGAVHSGAVPRPDCLKAVAVGGAKVADSDLEDARAAGIPAFQGYGLSECGSVVAISRPDSPRPQSVGQPLPGIDIRIADDGEILVFGQSMLGYLGEAPISDGPVATGDLGHFDDDGYLYVTGRKKNVFITSFGRNVSPEWPEAALLHEPEIAQACVFGEAMPHNTAVVVPADSAGSMSVASAIARANDALPDYAKVKDWVVASDGFSVANGQLTPTGKPRRDAIATRYILGADDSPATPHFGGGWSPSAIHN